MSQAQASSCFELSPSAPVYVPTNGRLGGVSDRVVLDFPKPFSDGELRQLAEALAAEFSYDESLAFVQPVTWYRNRVEAERCSLSGATVLRQMVVYECCAQAARRREARRLWTMMPPAPAAQVKDAPINRERRAGLYGSLPRVFVGTVKHRTAGRVARRIGAMTPRQRRAAWHLTSFSLGMAMAALLLAAVTMLRGAW